LAFIFAFRSAADVFWTTAVFYGGAAILGLATYCTVFGFSICFGGAIFAYGLT